MSFTLQRHWSKFERLPVRAGLLLLSLVIAPLALSESSRPLEYDLKAAFVFHFGQFVEWPDKTFTDSHAPLVIGLYGPDPFHGDLERMVAHKNINGHSVVIRQTKMLSELKECNVVFISAREQDHKTAILKALKGIPVLTVTEDMDHFSQSGFMINLFVADDKIRFEINNKAAEQAGLKISPKLLNLARPTQP